MPQVTFEKSSPVQGRIQVAITKDELNSKLTEALKAEKKRVSIKGFRKGKTPISALRKLMGNQLLGPMLDRTIQEALFGYIEEEKLDLIFSPIPVDNEEEMPQITATSLQDLNLTYDVALKPEFELKMPEQTFNKYVLDTNDEFLDEQVENMRKQMGENKEVEDGTIEENDVVDVTFRENDGELENSTKIYIDSLSDDGKALFTGKKVGDEVAIEDINQLEENSTDTYVKKYLLEIEEEEGEETDISGKTFTATVDKINRIELAELDEEFYTKFDPTGEVTDEEALRAKIAENNSSGFNDQGVGMLNFEIQRAMVENHDFELPIELMKQINEQDEGGREFDLFERGVRWMLVRGAFADQSDVKLEYEDVKAEATKSLMQMLGGQRPDFLTDEFIDNYVQNMLKDEEQREQLASSALENKIMAAIRSEVTTEDKPLSADEFNDTIKSFNEANTPAGEEE